MAILSSLTTDSMPPITVYLAQIRDLINPAFTESDLPDNLIEQNIFLRKAELDTYDRFAIITGKREPPATVQILHDIFEDLPNYMRSMTNDTFHIYNDDTYDKHIPTGQPRKDEQGTVLPVQMPSVNQRIISDKARITVMYRTAANIIPALPQILDEWVLRNKYEYAEIDWEKRKLDYEQEADKIIGIKEVVPEEQPGTAPNIPRNAIAIVITKGVFF